MIRKLQKDSYFFNGIILPTLRCVQKIRSKASHGKAKNVVRLWIWGLKSPRGEKFSFSLKHVRFFTVKRFLGS